MPRAKTQRRKGGRGERRTSEILGQFEAGSISETVALDLLIKSGACEAEAREMLLIASGGSDIIMVDDSNENSVSATE